ncbi:MAG: hypothetical protein E6J90_22035 [Deltaproteobacteria bacterium]|nr:MAG: hypothetical protein E6J90_22035 [Deltaproteobacteria bacterium]
MRQRLPMWASGAAVAGALAVLVAWSFAQRWQLLSASPFPLGVDGYFYPVELRALLERGELAYPASPLAFYLLAPLAAATDPITGAKLGAALWGAAIALPAYGVGARLGGGRGAGLVAAVLATTSVGSAYLTIEFVKNGIGLTVALGALWLALAAADRPTRARVAAALAGLVAAWAAHKMAAAIVVVVAVPAAIATAAARGRLRGRRLIYLLVALALGCALALGLAAAFPHRFLSVDDVRLARGLVSPTPHWAAPALVLPTGELAIGHDALIGLGLALAAIAAHLVHRRIAAGPVKSQAAAGSIPDATPSPDPVAASFLPVAAWPILGLAIAIGLPFLAVTDRDGLGFRLRIAAFVPAALCAALLVRTVLGAAAAVARRSHAVESAAHPVLGALGRPVQRDLVLAAVALGLAVLRQPGAWLDGEIVTHPALVSAAQALRGHVPPGATLIVPERHIAFLVAWYTGAPIAIRPDGVAPERRYRLLPLHFIGAGSALDHALIAARAEPSLIPPLGVHPRHPNGLVLVAEPTWTWVLDQLPAADRARVAAWPTI